MFNANKLFPPILITFPFLLIILLSDQQNAKYEMEKNKKELLLKVEGIFGKVIVNKDFSKVNGHAFWYFNEDVNYKRKMLLSGFNMVGDTFCYNGGSLEHQKDHYLVFKYSYPNSKCY